MQRNLYLVVIVILLVAVGGLYWWWSVRNTHLLPASPIGTMGTTTYTPTLLPNPSVQMPAPVTADSSVTLQLASGPQGYRIAAANGMTLYTFANDSKNASTCSGECAFTWPPYIVTASSSLSAKFPTEGAIAAVSRADGRLQVSYKGMPLYFYTNDKNPGDAKGDGIGKVWFVAKP